MRLLWRIIVNRWRWYRLPPEVRREATRRVRGGRLRPNGWD